MEGRAMSEKKYEPTKKSQEIRIPGLELKSGILTIKGLTPYLSNALSAETQKHIEGRQTGATNRKRRGQRDFQGELDRALYKLPDAEGYGFKATAIKQAMVTAGKLLGIPMTDARQMFRVRSINGSWLIPIIDSKGRYLMPKMVKHTGRRPPRTGGADIIVRGQFDAWLAKVEIEFDGTLISLEEVGKLLLHAGWKVGIGDWRPEKDGDYGTFTVL
jgi:hypothetical protein